MPRSRMNPRIAPSSVLAHTTAMSATGEFVIQVLAPVIENRLPPSIALAFVSIEPGSEPWFGSVSPKQPMSSPVASFGRNFSFCAAEPNSLMGCMTSDDWTDIAER
eukprot:Amastigsp_a676681_878.p5 type:complete len:106 gc:universal Amastigsp_a676681_878:725-408(-)